VGGPLGADPVRDAVRVGAYARPLPVAGTAVLAIRSAGSSLQQVMYAVNQCYEEGLYFTDYLAFCEDAATRVRAGGGTSLPDHPERIVATRVTFAYPGAQEPSLADVSVTYQAALRIGCTPELPEASRGNFMTVVSSKIMVSPRCGAGTPDVVAGISSPSPRTRKSRSVPAGI
jgi:hypothetical protein